MSKIKNLIFYLFKNSIFKKTVIMRSNDSVIICKNQIPNFKEKKVIKVNNYSSHDVFVKGNSDTGVTHHYDPRCKTVIDAFILRILKK